MKRIGIVAALMLILVLGAYVYMLSVVPRFSKPTFTLAEQQVEFDSEDNARKASKGPQADGDIVF